MPATLVAPAASHMARHDEENPLPGNLRASSKEDGEGFLSHDAFCYALACVRSRLTAVSAPGVSPIFCILGIFGRLRSLLIRSSSRAVVLCHPKQRPGGLRQTPDVRPGSEDQRPCCQPSV